jgi:hypothetical protein
VCCVRVYKNNNETLPISILNNKNCRRRIVGQYMTLILIILIEREKMDMKEQGIAVLFELYL